MTVIGLTADETTWLMRALAKVEAWVEREERERPAREARLAELEKRVGVLHDAMMVPGEDGRTLAQDVREIVADTKEAARARTKAISIVQAVILLSPALAGALAIWKGWVVAAGDLLSWVRR